MSEIPLPPEGWPFTNWEWVRLMNSVAKEPWEPPPKKHEVVASGSDKPVLFFKPLRLSPGEFAVVQEKESGTEHFYEAGRDGSLIHRGIVIDDKKVGQS